MQLRLDYLTVLTRHACIAEAAPNGSAAQALPTTPTAQAPLLQGASIDVPVHTAAQQQLSFQLDATRLAQLQGICPISDAGTADSLIPNGKEGRHGHKPPLYPAKRVHTEGRQQRQQVRSRMRTEPHLPAKYISGVTILWPYACQCCLLGCV